MSLSKKINDYLYFGYLPPKKLPAGLEEFKKIPDQYWKYNASDCGKLLDIVFDDSFDISGLKGNCVIPLSGGWDSRILLGLALNRLEPHQIKTYTFGQPGQFDYEIGATIAKKTGVEHVGIDLTDIEMDWDNLLNSVQLSPWTYVPDSFFNQEGYRLMATDKDIVLNGFMGDPLTGSHFIDDVLTIDGVRKHFVNKEKKANSSDMVEPGYEPLKSIPEIINNKHFDKLELLDFGIRQFHCIVPIISLRKNISSWETNLGKTEQGAEIVTPFSHPMWAQYWSGAPKNCIMERKLYVEMMKNKFPKLAELPSKTYYGASSGQGIYHYFMKKRFNMRIILHRNFPSLFTKQIKWLNYVDYQSAFITRDDYRAIWNQSVSFLNKNNIIPWIDLRQIMNEHENGHIDHSWVILTVIGLALNLAAEIETSNKEIAKSNSL